MGALESGLFDDLAYEVEILPPDEQKDDFCHNTVECNNQAPKVMAAWKDYFKVRYFSSHFLSQKIVGF